MHCVPLWTPRTQSTRPTFAGDVESSKPAPDLVEAALDRAGVPAYEAVFTGDTVWDVRACQKAGVPCIGLLSGGISRDELTAAGAAEVYPARLTCSRLSAAACWAAPAIHEGGTGSPPADHRTTTPPLDTGH
jgi:hypothetical protein